MAPHKDDTNLENAVWYHGFRPKEDAARLVKHPGEFLVRATDNGNTVALIITACAVEGTIVNLSLRFDDGFWSITLMSGMLSKRKFLTVVELMEHYMAHPPSKQLKLSKAILRPEWMLKHENVIYDEKDKLGTGNFCAVYKGLWKRTGGEMKEVAVKKSLISANATEAESEEAKEARKAMMREAQIMSFYTHEHVIEFCGVACDHPPVLVITEFCAGGDLLSHLLKHGMKTDEREKMMYLFECARGMLFLHNKKCVHRDLAARNCLISSTGRIKIADFGLSKIIDEGESDGDGATSTSSSNAQVPVRWMAPETLKKPPIYSRRSDVWSFGVLAFEVFNDGVKPWPEDPVKYVATQIRKGKMPKMPTSTPRKVVTLVDRMWDIVAEKRPAMRFIGRELHSIIKEQMVTLGQIKNECLTINKINGVTRETFFEFDNSSEFEESSNSSGNKGKLDPSLKRKKDTVGPPKK